MRKGTQAVLAAASVAFLGAFFTPAGQDAYAWMKSNLQCVFSSNTCSEVREEDYSELFNINGKINPDGNRTGYDLGTGHVTPKKEFGKRVISATIIDCPFEGKWQTQKVTPNGNGLLIELVPKPEFLAAFVNEAGPTFHVTFKVRYEV